MPADIQAVRNGADAIGADERAVGATLYDLSFVAEYGHGSTREAIDAIRSSRRHADRAVLAAAVGNAVVAAKHEAQAAAADADADHMLDRAKGHLDDLTAGLRAATDSADSAMGHARSLVGLDDSSPAAGLHARVAALPTELEECTRRAMEIDARVPRSRDPVELEVAADHFLALRHELEEASGRAQEIASDSLAYGNAV
jgi:hypothetical protein